MKGHHLNFEALVYKKTSQGYYRVYSRLRSKCKGCEYLEHCAMDRGRIRINASPFYPAFYANMHRCGTVDYKAMKRLRAIWSEGTFAVLKREHNLKRARKRGLNRVSEECLLSALALNLKRIVKVAGDPPKPFELTIIFQY
ncbi:MAG: transposase [Clostridia bacterium]|nr:transposase [Clostridia bacterium]